MAKRAFVEEYQQRPGAGGQSNAVYAAMLQSVDESVGRVMQKLADLHLSERTVVIITSDNGGAVHFGNPPATSNSPLRLGKGYPYEGGLRVPLIISVPGMRQPGATSDFPVISHDLFPTLLELAGAKPPSSGIDGKSLVPLLNGQTRLDRSELFWHYPHYWNGKGTTPYSIVRLGDWKLIRFYEYDREELYNLENDIGEEHDLAGANPEKRGELALRLDNWLKEVGAQLPVARPGK
jgi:arylsulfatase A-like enzyme